MKVAIHQNKDIFNHSSTWDSEWIEYCESNAINFEIVDCFSNNVLEQLKRFDILLWHFSNYSYAEMEFARSIIHSAKHLGLKVFPDINDSWHFDDKVAESYLLDSVNAPIPSYKIFYTYKDVKIYLKTNNPFPVIAKLRRGAGSNNVQMLESKKELLRYSRKMFGSGIDPSPKVGFKTVSNINSTKNRREFLKRIKRIPDFIQTLKKSNELFNEKGYVYLQEFIPNEGYDLKVVVVGKKLSFLSRNIRKDDFRASGGGSINYDPSLITDEIRAISFKLNEKLGFQCMGYDFVIDKTNNEPKIIEISYGFSHLAQIESGGHWTVDNNWIEDSLNAPVEILENLLK